MVPCLSFSVELCAMIREPLAGKRAGMFWLSLAGNSSGLATKLCAGIGPTGGLANLGVLRTRCPPKSDWSSSGLLGLFGGHRVAEELSGI
jgi:hypothetical protein